MEKVNILIIDDFDRFREGLAYELRNALHQIKAMDTPFRKENIPVNYNGQLHNLRRRADQKDFALRMHQFFDHFLKGSAKPAWMEKGISYLDREDEKERFGRTQGAAAESAK